MNVPFWAVDGMLLPFSSFMSELVNVKVVVAPDWAEEETVNVMFTRVPPVWEGSDIPEVDAKEILTSPGLLRFFVSKKPVVREVSCTSVAVRILELNVIVKSPPAMPSASFTLIGIVTVVFGADWVSGIERMREEALFIGVADASLEKGPSPTEFTAETL